MAGHFQATFSVAGPGAHGMALLEEVGSVVRRLTSELADAPELVDASDGEWASDKGRVRLSGGNSGEAGYSRLSWILPNGWEMRCRIATHGTDVEFETDVYGPGAGDDLARAPRMLAELIDRFECHFRGQRLTTTVSRISQDNAGAFVEDFLFGLSRRLPIVVVSESVDGVTLVDSEELQSRILGLAQVVTYGTEMAATINKDLGRHGCFGGAVRLYTPGFKRTDEPGQHRLWSPARVRLLQLSLWREVRDACMASVLLEVGSRIYEEVPEQVRKAEMNEMATLVAEITESMESSDSKRTDLESRIRELQDKLAETQQEDTAAQQDLQGQLDVLQSQMEAIEQERQNAEAASLTSQIELGFLRQQLEDAEKSRSHAAMTKEQLANKDQEILRLKAQITSQEHEIQDSAKAYLRSNDEQPSTKRKVGRKLDGLQRDKDELEREVRNLEGRLSSLERERIGLIAENADLKAQLRPAEDDNSVFEIVRSMSS